jgi:uncharacterized protein (UPF0371 family)
MDNLPNFTPEQEREIARFEELYTDLEVVLSDSPYKTQFDVLAVMVAELIISEHRDISSQKEELDRFVRLAFASMEKNKEDAEMIDEYERQFNK